MPYIEVKTNITVEKKKSEQLKDALGSAIALIPGKSERWLMVGISGGETMYFSGSDLPCAMAKVSIFGSAEREYLEKLTCAICKKFSEILGIPADRTYVRYQFCDDWGWNGSDF